MLHEEITSQILAAFFAVYNQLGYGFLEKVYENAMIIELDKHGLKVTPQASIQVCYDGKVIGDYYADLLVEDLVVIELKAVEQIIKAHENQLVNYLRAGHLEVGLLLNFGPEPQFKRKIFTHTRKPMIRQS